MKKKLKTHFTSLEKEYKRPTSFQLTLLQPYLSYLQLPVDNNDNSCSFGFADTQMAISTAFVYDTIPYMKTLERMTNPCFQDTDFATVMKGKHVTNAWDKTGGLVESVDEVLYSEVSDSDKESVHDDGNDDVSVISLFPQQNKESFNDDINPGSDNGSVNEVV